MTRIAVVVNAVGAIAVTTAVLMAHGASDRGDNATDTVIRPISADDFTLLDAGREPDLSAGVGATDVDASEFLGPGWHLRIQPGVIVAERAPEAPAR